MFGLNFHMLVVCSFKYKCMKWKHRGKCSSWFSHPTLRLSSSVSVFIKFLHPWSGTCDQAFVEVRDGGTILSPLLGKFCGSNLPDTQHSSGDVLYVRYYNNLTQHHSGFKAKVSTGKGCSCLLCISSSYNCESPVILANFFGDIWSIYLCIPCFWNLHSSFSFDP